MKTVDDAAEVFEGVVEAAEDGKLDIGEVIGIALDAAKLLGNLRIRLGDGHGRVKRLRRRAVRLRRRAERLHREAAELAAEQG